MSICHYFMNAGRRHEDPGSETTWLLMIEAVASVWPSHLCDFPIFLKDEGKDSAGWLHTQWAEFTEEIWDWDILHLNSKQKEACFFCGWRCYLFTQSSLLQTQAWELGRIKYGQARTLISWHIQQEYAWIFRAVVDLLSQKLYVDVIGLSGLVLYAANLLNSYFEWLFSWFFWIRYNQYSLCTYFLMVYISVVCCQIIVYLIWKYIFIVVFTLPYNVAIICFIYVSLNLDS